MTSTIYANKNHEITIICPQCGKIKQQTLPNTGLTGKPLKVKCSCGHIFPALIEGRRHYRKRVTLFGTCSTSEAVASPEKIVVEDISFYGLRFRTAWKNQYQVGEVLRVSFVLDNMRQTVITKTVVVKSVRDRLVGAAFHHPDEPNATFGFYLMPA